MIARAIAAVRAAARFDFLVVAFGLLALVTAQLTLSNAFHGTNFGGH